MNGCSVFGVRFDQPVSLYSMGLDNYLPAISVLVVGNPADNASIVAACRCEENRRAVDSAVLPEALEIEPDDSDLPQHPMVLIRTYDNVQMVMRPETLRFLGAWMAAAADWLDSRIEGGQ